MNKTAAQLRSVCLCVCVFESNRLNNQPMRIYPFVCLLSVHPFVRPSVRPSVYLHVRFFARLLVGRKRLNVTESDTETLRLAVKASIRMGLIDGTVRADDLRQSEVVTHVHGIVAGILSKSCQFYLRGEIEQF